MASPPLLNYCECLNFSQAASPCSLCNNTASSLETDAYHKPELRLTLRSADLVPAKASFQTSHNSHLPASEAVTFAKMFRVVGGMDGFGFWGAWEDQLIIDK